MSCNCNCLPTEGSYTLPNDKSSDINLLDIMLIPFGIGLITIP